MGSISSYHYNYFQVESSSLSSGSELNQVVRLALVVSAIIYSDSRYGQTQTNCVTPQLEAVNATNTLNSHKREARLRRRRRAQLFAKSLQFCASSSPPIPIPCSVQNLGGP